MQHKPKTIRKMKRYIILILAALCSLTVMADNEKPERDQQTIILIGSSMPDGGRIRSLINPVEAILYYSTSSVVINMDEIGAGEVGVVDSYGNLIESANVYDGMVSITLPAPEIDGCYTLYISCENYYGEGYFTIE